MKRETPLSKEDELTILDAAIANLGPHSYCGPWLESIKAEVIRDMRSDLPPCPSMKWTRLEYDRIIAEAVKRAEEIIETAQQSSDKIRRESRQTVEWAASKLRDALRRLNE